MNEMMNPEHMNNEQRLAAVELSLRQYGLLGEIAAKVVDKDFDLDAHEAGDILLPPMKAGDVYQSRVQLIEGATATLKAAIDAKRDEILAMAERLGLRQEESLTIAQLERIKPDSAVWMIEGGANRSSIVRRQLAIEAMQAVYGTSASEHTIFQLGSDRAIPSERNDKPNPEYQVAQEVGGDYLPETDSLTEFKLNLATALQSGYVLEAAHSNNYEHAEEVLVLRRDDSPTLVLVRPANQGNGLADGFTAVSELIGDMEGKQIVIATNGHYRPKGELQATRWAKHHDIAMHVPVALGDEAGYQVVHDGKTLTTADRPTSAYVNEIVILNRV